MYMDLPRRHFLSLAAVAAVTGCTGNDDSGATEQPDTETPTDSSTPDPAVFDIGRYEAPERVEVGAATTISITIENVGGRAGEFTAPLYVELPSGTVQRAATVEFGQISPGGSATIEAGPLTFAYLGDYSIRLGERSPLTTVQVVPLSLVWGDGYRTPSEFELSVSEPELQATIEYEAGYGSTENRGPSGDRYWAFVDISVTNKAATTMSSPGASDFDLIGTGATYDSYALADDPIDRGQRFESGDIRPDETRSGWIVYAVDSSLTAADMRVSWSATIADGEVAAEWQSEA